MQSSKSILVVMMACMLLLVPAQAAPSKMGADECSKRADQLDGLMEEAGEELTNYVEDKLVCKGDHVECIKKDPKVREGVSGMVRLAEELGEMKACARVPSPSASDLNEAVKEQLHETITVVSSSMADLTPRSRQLFQQIVEEAEKAYGKLPGKSFTPYFSSW